MRVRIKWSLLLLISLVFLCGVSPASASTPVRIVAGVVTNVASALFKWLWSVSLNTPPPRTTNSVSGRSVIKFEGGYAVETVFDGSKLGIEPYSVEVSPSGELIILDSINSNVHKVSSPLSRYSRPKLLAGSLEGYTGHVDGKLREAKMYHPKGVAVDDRGNIYIADTMNMAVRKISNTGVVTTIAGGRSSRGGHVDGPSEEAKFSDDFDVVYVRSSCSLLVIDRGNRLIREIQLQYDDCNSSQLEQPYEGGFHMGVVILLGVAFFGYMLALLQQRVRALFSSSPSDPRVHMKSNMVISHTPVIPPLIPSEDEYDKGEEGFFTSFGKLIFNTISTTFEILGGLFTVFRRKKQKQQRQVQPQFYHQPIRHINVERPIWPNQDGYIIQDDDEPPPMEARSPRNDAQLERICQNREAQGYHGRVVDGELQLKHQRQQDVQRNEQNQQQIQAARQHQQQPPRHYATVPKNCCERGSDPNEILFGAVQDQDGRRETVVIKAVDYSDPVYNHHNIRPRLNYMGYSSYKY